MTWDWYLDGFGKGGAPPAVEKIGQSNLRIKLAPSTHEASTLGTDEDSKRTRIIQYFTLIIKLNQPLTWHFLPWCLQSLRIGLWKMRGRPTSGFRSFITLLIRLWTLPFVDNCWITVNDLGRYFLYRYVITVNERESFKRFFPQSTDMQRQYLIHTTKTIIVNKEKRSSEKLTRSNVVYVQI